MKAVTMKDISTAMGVSVVTVSKALAGKSGVSEEMREKIIMKARELGYLHVNQSNDNYMQGNIGILVADRFFTDNSFYSNMYREIVLECSTFNISCLMEIVTSQQEEELTLPNFLISNKGDGVIFMGEISSDYVKAVAKTGIPYILLDFYDDSGNEDSIVSDSLLGSFRLTSYLIECGHQEIGFVGSLLATSSILDRYLGYCKAMIKHQIEPRREWLVSDRDSKGHFIPIKLPESMPHAFVCNCDEIAYMLVETLKQEGYQIPEDVSVVGFDDFRFATICNPPLTTFKVDIESMGKAAVAKLLNKINKNQYTKGRTIVCGELIIRSSVISR